MVKGPGFEMKHVPGVIVEGKLAGQRQDMVVPSRLEDPQEGMKNNLDELATELVRVTGRGPSPQSNCG